MAKLTHPQLKKKFASLSSYVLICLIQIQPISDSSHAYLFLISTKLCKESHSLSLASSVSCHHYYHLSISLFLNVLTSTLCRLGGCRTWSWNPCIGVNPSQTEHCLHGRVLVTSAGVLSVAACGWVLLESAGR